MKHTNIFTNLAYNPHKAVISVLMETEASKEIRIVMASETVMKEHSTPYPIIIEIVEGSIAFGVEGKVHNLIKGDMLALDGKIRHDLKALSNSIVRLTLVKEDSTKRVVDVIEI
ncbi:MAG TPA: hypothetical protein PKD85_08570 [Saprospiraceae bacterium]|nr:hypothetical protein [Saprospiraceae bacterium]